VPVVNILDMLLIEFATFIKQICHVFEANVLLFYFVSEYLFRKRLSRLSLEFIQSGTVS